MAEAPAYFDEGRLPVTNVTESSHHFLDNLRKRLLIWKFPHIGRAPYAATAGVYTDNWTSGPTTAAWNKGTKIVFWQGEIWVNNWDIADDEVLPYPPYEYRRPIRVTHSGMVYKSLKVHKSSSDFAADLAAGAWAVDTATPHNANEEDWYTIPAWEAGVEYWIVEWISTYNGWQLHYDFNKYHDFDTHHVIDSEHLTETHPRMAMKKMSEGGGTLELITEDLSYYASQLLPVQTDEIENHAPVHYIDTDKTRWTYKNKVGLDSAIITVPTQMGAQWTTEDIGYEAGDHPVLQRGCPTSIWAGARIPAVLGNQYQNGDNLPADCSGSGWDKNPKINGCYQTMIEVYAECGLRFPVTAEYITNWEAITGSVWSDDPQGERENYPHAGEIYFERNSSSFEFLLRQNNKYDWYWDEEYPFIRTAHQIAIQNGGSPEEYPEPVGTWRGTWHNSFGRPSYANGTPKMMAVRLLDENAVEIDTPPTVGNYPSDRHGGAALRTFSFDTHVYSEIDYPDGTFVTTLPEISVFYSGPNSFSHTVLAHSNNGVQEVDIFKVEGNHVAKYKIGGIVHFGTGTAVADYIDHWAYILQTSYDGVADNTYVRVNIAITAFINQNVKGDTDLMNRHDPVQVDAITLTPTYELTADLMNEMRDVMVFFVRQRITPSVEERSAFSLHSPKDDGADMLFGSVAAAYSYLRTLKSIPSNPDDWTGPGEITYEADGVGFASLTYGGGNTSVGTAEAAVSWAWNDELGGYRATISGGYGKWGRAIKVLMPAMYNSSAVVVRFIVTDISNYRDMQYLTGIWHSWMRDPAVQAQSAGGLSQTFYDPGLSYPYNEPVTHYIDIAVPANGPWLPFIPTNWAVPACIETNAWNVPPPEHSGYVFMGAAYLYFSYNIAHGLIIVLDYNKVPASVFDRVGLTPRDNWGLIERDVAPILDDTQPPLPDPAEFRIEPYAEFEYITQDDAVGSFVVTSQANNIITVTKVTPLVNNDLVELFAIEDGVLPSGLVADKIYKVSDVSGSTCKLRDRANGLDGDPVDITGDGEGGGSGHLQIKLATCFSLNIKAELRMGEDLEGSNPVHYQAICTAGSFYDTGFDVSRFINIVDRYLSMHEAQQGGIALEGISIVIDDLDDTYHVILPCVTDPTTYIAVNDTIRILQSPHFDATYTVSARDSTTITIDVGDKNYMVENFDPQKNRLYKTTDAIGYGVVQWEEEDAYDYKFKAQMRDAASPQNNLTGLVFAKECGVTAPPEYPMDLL